MKSVESLTVLLNVNVPNRKHLARKSLKHRVMGLVISLATNLNAIVATQIALMSVQK